MQNDLIRQCSESMQGAMWVLAKGALSWNVNFCWLTFTVNLYVHHLMFKIIPIRFRVSRKGFENPVSLKGNTEMREKRWLKYFFFFFPWFFCPSVGVMSEQQWE